MTLLRTLAWALLVAAAAAAAQQRGGTAVIVVQADPTHLNPGISTGSHVHAVADSLYNALIELDRDLKPQPDLATRWTVGDGGSSYTFELARGVKWHDGMPFTSADVKFTFDEILLKHHARTKAGIGAVIASIETPAADRVVFKLKKPYGALLQLLNVTEAPILPKHIYQGADPLTHPANIKPVGTGPFKLDSYRTDQQVVLVRNPDYFKPGLPYLDRLVFRVVPDSSAQTVALLAGEADYLALVNAADVERLRARNDLKIAQTAFGTGGGNCINTLSFNLDRKPLADLRVRQAIALAIDREQILRDVQFGLGKVPAAPISSGLTWAHAPGTLQRYAAANPQRAAELLDAAGLAPGADGTRLNLELLHFPTFNRVGEVLRQNLAKVGIKVTQKPLDRAAFIDAVFAQRAFDLNIISYCNGADPDSGVRRMYVSNNIGNVPFSNAAAYRNPEVDKLFAQAAETADYAERSRHYAAAQKIIADELPYWWLTETVVTTAWRAKFDGWQPWSGQVAERAWMRP
ncbi:MAG TPA: ABC transporter substrate-binding protein [Burkholderiaceae bacterium]|nr:ABC transporter substrate-binding protein [Burkholderiaceae bacterium]